jgi:ribosomal protein S18 acetylase RimI-like enzyme
LEHDRGVLISAVTVLPDARRRGIGTALTTIALQVTPGRSATLSATVYGLPLYRRLGFVEVGRQRYWQQSPFPGP